MRNWIFALVLCLGHAAGAAPLQLWLYCQTNLLPDENVAKLETLWRRAAKAGYAKILLADSKFARLGDLGENQTRYFAHVARLRALAKELHLEIVPAGLPMGYSNDMLWHDPNLAEGLPVRGALFEVRRGEAKLVADPAVKLGDRPDWHDDALSLNGAAATENGHKENARLVWKVKVAPYRAYHVAVDIRTKEYTGTPEIKALADGKSLCFTGLRVAKTQDWKTHHIVFDSLDHKEVSLYLGVWGDATGSLSWRNWRIEEAGPVNILRRAGTPCVVEGQVEGKDYDPIVDPKSGRVPWGGEYDVWHDAPKIITHLPEGTRLRISWYFPAIIGDGQVGACPSDDKVYELMADEVKRLRAAWAPRGIMMSHDEIRALNQDEGCAARKLTPGELLADNVRRCVKLLEGGEVYVWSDMFDPFHNAHDDYYLVRGDLAGSWLGLDPKVTVVNWNFDHRADSLAFFAGRGHRQVIAGYYDGAVGNVRQWLSAAAGVKGVTGIMYTTWRGDYDNLEAFARIVGEAAK